MPQTPFILSQTDLRSLTNGGISPRSISNISFSSLPTFTQNAKFKNHSNEAFEPSSGVHLAGTFPNHAEVFVPDQIYPFPLLILALDRFGEVNQSLGYQFGNLLLSQIEQRVRELLGPAYMISRLGGAEFLVLPYLGSAEDAGLIVGKILQAIHQPFQLGDVNFFLQGRIGIALYPEHGGNVEVLIQRARAALSMAKSSRSEYVFYSAEQARKDRERFLLAGHLHSAIDEDQFLLLYQPKVDLKTGRPTGAEALLRWQHPQFGTISPDIFIPLAEQTGLIHQLTSLVINKILRQCNIWNRAGLKIKVAANVSAWDLHSAGFADHIADLLATYEVLPTQLKLEITESAVITNHSRVVQTLNCMRDMGLRISVDDFGTGYSSLSYLRKLPISEIKIDKSFVMRMAEENDDAVIVQSTIDLAHKLGLKVVAEGVENKRTKKMLTSFKCDVAQGYYISRPITPEQFIHWLRQSQELLTHRMMSSQIRKTGKLSMSGLSST